MSQDDPSEFFFKTKGQPFTMLSALAPHVGQYMRIRVVKRGTPLEEEGQMGEVVAVDTAREPISNIYTPSDYKAALRMPDQTIRVYRGNELIPIRASWRARAHVRRNYIKTGNWFDDSRRRR
jgi:hypothetical protein